MCIRDRECTMYITLEPCQMCAGAIVQARIPKVVIGCRNPKAGCAGSILNLLNVPAFNHQVELTEGILQEECSTLLKEFFRKLRKIDVYKRQVQSFAEVFKAARVSGGSLQTVIRGTAAQMAEDVYKRQEQAWKKAGRVSDRGGFYLWDRGRRGSRSCGCGEKR